MITRDERRRRNEVHYDRKVKNLYYTCSRSIQVEKDETNPNDRCASSGKYWHKADSWIDFKNRSNWVYLYKNTGTIYDHGYWSKYERRRLNKQSRINARLDIKKGEEVPFVRTNIK